MTKQEAADHYPDKMIIIKLDDMDSDIGSVICVGDDDSDLINFLNTLEDDTECLITEGRHLRCCLGGVVVGV